jgi:hypothetical protein
MNARVLRLKIKNKIKNYRMLCIQYIHYLREPPVRTNASIHSQRRGNPPKLKTLIAANRVKFNIYLEENVDGVRYVHRLTLQDAYDELGVATDWDSLCYWRSMVAKGEALRTRYERDANADLLRHIGGPR